MAYPIKGMENVIATVSGYQGSERFNLIKLISHSGASYVGAMSRSITHLVCWKLEGKKYSLAKKFNTIIVNHQWIEECVKQGRHIPETPYMSRSGEEAGPFVMEVPLVSKDSELTTKQIGFSEKVDLYGGTSKASRKLGASQIDTWTDSSLLKEINGETHTRYLGSGRKKRNSLVVDKRNTCLAESSRKNRRLVKKNAHRNIVNLDSDQECQINSPKILCDRQNKAEDLKHSDSNRSVRIAGFGETSVHCQPYDHSGTTSGGPVSIQETETWNHSSGFKIPWTHHVDASNAVARTSQDSGSEKKPESKEQNAEANENVFSLASSAGLSCVICYTEFSSTRGILPCGHRFCYSCIQSWADKLASQRKNSTCPLCKAGFDTITKVEDAGSSDQKIYSQTIPCPSSVKDIFIIDNQERPSFGAQCLPLVCSKCRFREPEELLISCSICSFRCIHSYCMDPYLLPWTCIHCKDMQTLYRHAH